MGKLSKKALPMLKPDRSGTKLASNGLMVSYFLNSKCLIADYTRSNPYYGITNGFSNSELERLRNEVMEKGILMNELTVHLDAQLKRSVMNIHDWERKDRYYQLAMVYKSSLS